MAKRITRKAVRKGMNSAIDVVQKLAKESKKRQPFTNYTPTEGFVGGYQMQTGKAIDNLVSKANNFDVYGRDLVSAAFDAQQRADQFNAEQAQINRDWQESMSATAHQREVADLKAAGLNPVLSVNSGAPVGSGATASSSNALTGVLGELAATAMSAVSNMSQSMASNTAGIYSMLEQQRTAKQNMESTFNASVYGSKMSYLASKYAADLSSHTQLSMNQANLQMQKYIAELQSLTSKEVARISGEYNVKTTAMNNYIQQNAAELSYLAALKTNAASNFTSMINTAGTNANNAFISLRRNATDLDIAGKNNQTSFVNNVITNATNIVRDFVGSRRIKF